MWRRSGRARGPILPFPFLPVSSDHDSRNLFRGIQWFGGPRSSPPLQSPRDHPSPEERVDKIWSRSGESGAGRQSGHVGGSCYCLPRRLYWTADSRTWSINPVHVRLSQLPTSQASKAPTKFLRNRVAEHSSSFRWLNSLIIKPASNKYAATPNRWIQ